MRNVAEKIAPNIKNALALAAANDRIRSSCSGSIGSGARRSQATKPASSTTPAPSATMTSRLPQPEPGARTRPQAMLAEPAATSTAPGRSSRAAGPRLSASRSLARPAAARPMGTLTQKIQCQSRPWVTAPPTSGPAAMARLASPPQIPMIVPRRAGGKAAVRMVRLSGVTIAAPRPWIALAPMRLPASGASAQPADPVANSSRPAA